MLTLCVSTLQVRRHRNCTVLTGIPFAAHLKEDCVIVASFPGLSVQTKNPFFVCTGKPGNEASVLVHVTYVSACSPCSTVPLRNPSLHPWACTLLLYCSSAGRRGGERRGGEGRGEEREGREGRGWLSQLWAECVPSIPAPRPCRRNTAFQCRSIHRGDSAWLPSRSKSWPSCCPAVHLCCPLHRSNEVGWRGYYFGTCACGEDQ